MGERGMESMKRIGIILAALALLISLKASADEMPGEVRALYLADGYGPETVSDILNIRDAEGSDWCLIAQTGGGMNGYRRLASGAWENDWIGDPWFPGGDTRFVREGEAAFRVESAGAKAWMRYESRGRGFALTAWRDENAYPGRVEIGGGEAVFLPDGGGEKAVIPIGEELRDWLFDFDSLPKTPEEMRARADIGRERTAALMPGWTLGYYEMYNAGTEASAAFFRVTDGRLTVRRALLESGKGAAWQSESAAVPLSPALAEKLKTEEAGKLLDVSGYGSTFLTEDAWDRDAIPIQGTIVENSLQTHGLAALTEREGKRRITIAEPDADGVWRIRETGPLPEGAWLDLFHAGDGELDVRWMLGEKECQCGFLRRADGAWRMAWAWTEEGDYTVDWCGVRVEFVNEFNSVYACGSVPFADLFAADLAALPDSAAEAARQVDTAGWAAVRNPNPEDRLHLRTEPGKSGDSLGKFYNGTPLRVLEEKGDWLRVRIGQEPGLEGWMMRAYLAEGEALRRVEPHFPELFLREECRGKRPRRIDGGGEADFTLNGSERIVGVRQETGQWIVMAEDGRLCLVPLSWFWEGNG